MEAFATVADYRSAYRTSEPDERVEAMLDKASRKIRAAMRADGLSWEDPDEELSGSLSDVCCDMTHRALGDDMPAGDAQLPFGVTRAGMQTGPYMRDYSFGNPYGDLFLTKAEREQLGIGVAAIGSIAPRIGDDGGDDDDV